MSLVLKKLKVGHRDPDLAKTLIETYRDKALDVFVRGLNSDTSKFLLIGPKSLPEAFPFSFDLKNVSFRGDTDCPGPINWFS